VELYKEGQRLLERQRFQFPSTWLYSDNVEGEWSAFSDIIHRKDSSIQTQVASLQMKVISEDKVVESRTGELLTEWEKEKPVEVCYMPHFIDPGALHPEFVLTGCSAMYRVGQKNRTCLSVDNSEMVSGKKTCVLCQKF